MWRSTVITARRFRSSKPISRFQQYYYYSKPQNPQPTLSSYPHSNHSKNLPLFQDSPTIRFFTSNGTAPDPNLEMGPHGNDKNDENGVFNIGEVWNEGISDANTVLESNSSDSSDTENVPNSENVLDTEAVGLAGDHGHGHGVDVDQLDRVVSFLVDNINDVDVGVRLGEMNLKVNEEFVVRVLEGENVSGESLIGFFKWAAAGGGKEEAFGVTTRCVDALVRGVAKEMKKKVAYSLWDLVKEIGEKDTSVVSTEALNALISLFSRLGKGMAGYEVYSKFGDFGCEANADTYFFTIEALCRRSIFDRVGLVCERMVSEEKLPEAGKVGDIVYYLCKGGMVKEARSVYLLAKEKQRYPSQSSVNFLISSLCDRKKNDSDSVHFALKMLEDLDKPKYAIKQFSSVIQGLCRVDDIEGAKDLLSKMIVNSPPPGNAIFNTVINALSKSGDMSDAIKIMRMMENRGLKPDVFAYSVIMSGYIKGGEMEEAAKMLKEAKKNHSKLTPVIYHTIIRGYCKLEQFGKAVKLLKEMEDYGVRPNSDEYNKLIQSLCLKAADWVTAEKLMEEMTNKGLHLNGITKSLIRATKELEEETQEINEASVEA